MHINYVKVLLHVFLLFLLINKVDGASIYSGNCVYPGGIFKIDLSIGLPANNDYRVTVRAEHTKVEFYDNINKVGGVLIPGSAGRFSLSELNYVKINTISGPYLKLIFDIYNDRGVLVSTISSGGICNLNWFREKHGTFGRYFSEKVPAEIDEALVSTGFPEKGKNIRAAVFCMISFVLGGFMGFRTPKMIEY